MRTENRIPVTIDGKTYEANEGERLSDLLIRTALERKYGAVELAPLDDALERMAHDEMCEKLGGKTR